MPLRRNWTPAFRILLALAITVISYFAFTPIHYPVIESVWDKLWHGLAFAVLGLLLDRSFPAQRFEWRKLLVLAGYGLFVEAVQHFLPYRSFELADLVADTAGAALYFAIATLPARATK